MSKILALLALLYPGTAFGAKAVMEGIPATGHVISVATTTPRVYLSTNAYTGGVSSVGLVTSSNVVISNTQSSNFIVLYATGTVYAQRFQGSGAGLTDISSTFASTVTVGPTLGTVVADHGAIIYNVWTIVASTRVVAVTGVTFTNLRNDASTQYRLNMDWVQNTSAGTPRVQVNSDGTASKHVYRNEPGGTATGSTLCNFTSGNASTTRAFHAVFWFSAGVSGAAILDGFVHGHWFADGGNVAPFSSSCQYNNTTVSSMLVQTSAGTMTGSLYLEALMPRP